MKRVSVLMFATVKDSVGTNRLELSLDDGATVKDLKLYLADQYPDFTALLTSTLASVNQKFAFDDNVLPDGAEVALFPPVSGG